MYTITTTEEDILGVRSDFMGYHTYKECVIEDSDEEEIVAQLQDYLDSGGELEEKFEVELLDQFDDSIDVTVRVADYIDKLNLIGAYKND